MSDPIASPRRAVLILINGLPAAGKSTLARQWCERNPRGLPLALDIDSVRGTLGGWRQQPTAAGLAARAIATAAIGTHLRSGRDVVVPQYLGRPEFADELAELAAASDAAFVECVLEVEPAEAAARFATRAAAGAHGRNDEGELERSMVDVHEDLVRFLLDRHDAVRLPPGPDLLERLDDAVQWARRR